MTTEDVELVGDSWRHDRASVQSVAAMAFGVAHMFGDEAEAHAVATVGREIRLAWLDDGYLQRLEDAYEGGTFGTVELSETRQAAGMLLMIDATETQPKAQFQKVVDSLAEFRASRFNG
jgi:hypothetical protein